MSMKEAGPVAAQAIFDGVSLESNKAESQTKASQKKYKSRT